MKKLLGIQGLCGVAALAVVAYHAARHLGQAVDASAITRLTQPGHAGVDLFFVLSGFIIFHVHQKDIGRPEALGRYAWQRFIRLAPIYWIAVAAAIVLLLPRHSDELSAVRIGLSASLLPIQHEPLLGVAWTLQHEMLFYLATAMLILSRALGIFCFFGWAMWALAQQSGLFPQFGPEIIGSLFNLEFLFGIAAAFAVKQGWIKYGGILALAAGAVLIAVGITEASGMLYGYGNLARLAYGIPSAVLVAALAVWEQKKQRRIPVLPVIIGEASYSLYLFHLLGIGIGWQFWVLSGIDTVENVFKCYAFLLSCGILSGIFSYYLIEFPLLRYLRRQTISRSLRNEITDATHGYLHDGVVVADKRVSAK